MPENLASEIEFVMNGTGCRVVLSMGRVNKFKGNLDHYLWENGGLKKVMITLSSFTPFALSNILIATVLGKLSKLYDSSQICTLPILELKG